MRECGMDKLPILKIEKINAALEKFRFKMNLDSEYRRIGSHLFKLTIGHF